MTLKDQLSPERIAVAGERLRAALADSPVPTHLHDGLVRYIEWGILPGGFMQAVLCCDFPQAVARHAGGGAAFTITVLFQFLERAAPSQAWGSREKVLAWTTTPHRLEV
jgi:hypothetical protein